MGPVAQQIADKLCAAFQPNALEILDESDRHAGHAGWDARGETHLRLRIVAPAFHGKSRVEIHRMIFSVLQDELRERVHALAIEAKSP